MEGPLVLDETKPEFLHIGEGNLQHLKSEQQALGDIPAAHTLVQWVASALAYLELVHWELACLPLAQSVS